MAQIFTVQFENVAVTAAQDFFELTPADDRPIEIVGLFLSQSTELGDAQEEQLRLRIIRGHTTSGSGGSAPTPRPVKRNGGAAGFTAEANNTTIASAGTTHNLHSETFNVRVGYANWWPEGAEPEATQADTTIVIRLLAAPADSVTMGGTVYVREV